MWFRGAERGLLFTAGQTNRISNSGTLSWEGHGSDPIITQTWVLGEVKAGVYFFFPRAYMVEAAGPLSTSLAACLSTTGPSPLICRGQGNKVSSLLFLAFLFFFFTPSISFCLFKCSREQQALCLAILPLVLPIIPLLRQGCMLIELVTQLSPPLTFTTTAGTTSLEPL